MQKGIGKQTLKALRLINEHTIYTGRDFARLMWPDSPCWKKVYNIGHGATRGVGMWLAGGSFTSKLWQADLIKIDLMDRMPMTLTDKGKALIGAH